MNRRKKNKVPAGLRIFEGSSIFEAYSKLKRELGNDAVILSTKNIKRGGILGFWGQKVIQITASDDVKAPSRSRTPETPLPKKAEVVPKAPVETPQAQMDLTSPTLPFNDFKQELAEIRRMIQDIQNEGHHKMWPDLPPQFQKAYEKLQSFNISDDIARALIHRWKSHYPDYQKGQKVDIRLLEGYIEEMLVPGGPIRFRTDGQPTVVMLVGPTGVGKTTSIAKLAARFKIQEHKRVALITIDTYRIAAVEQLKTYADLIGLPLKVISEAQDLKAAIKSFSDRDLILIDSAGRSPRSVEKMNELKNFVEAAQADELHLVCSTSVSSDVMKDTLDRYANFPVNKLLLTKLDETVHYGMILSIISKMQNPIGYLATGQEVPDDIEVASQKRLSRLILNLDRIDA
jgi:flagellar biosynthesis protein FlhF